MLSAVPSSFRDPSGSLALTNTQGDKTMDAQRLWEEVKMLMEEGAVGNLDDEDRDYLCHLLTELTLWISKGGFIPKP